MEINLFWEHQIFCRRNPSIPDRTKVFTFDQIMNNPIAYDELLEQARTRGIYEVLVYIPDRDIVAPVWISRMTWKDALMNVNDYYWRGQKPWTYAELRNFYLIVGNPSLKNDL